MHAEYKMPGGKLLVIDITVQEGYLNKVRLSGDFFLEPAEALDQINQLLEGLGVDTSETEIAQRIRDGLDPRVQMYGISPEAIATVVRRAIL